MPNSKWVGAGPFVSESGHEPILLWPGLPPYAAANASPQTAQAGEGNRVRNITVPQLLPYFPAIKPINGTAIIYCPGGGYGFVAVGRPSLGQAAVWNPRGVTVFILMYRQKGTKQAKEVAFQDAQRAVRLVRSRALEWNLDPSRIGLAGGCAGANLTLRVMADFNKAAATPPAVDAVEEISARPDFTILISCWAGRSETSPYKMVPNSPPSFIGRGKNDNLSKIGISIDVAQQLTALKIPVLYKEYDRTGHGLRGIPWTKDFIPWLQAQGKLDSPAMIESHSETTNSEPASNN